MAHHASASTRVLTHSMHSPDYQQQQQHTSAVGWEADLGGCTRSASQRSVSEQSTKAKCKHAHFNPQHAQPRPAIAAHLGGGLGGGFGGLHKVSESASSQ